MADTSPSIARSQRSHAAKMQTGTIVSYTTVRHPPAGFPHHPRTIGLIQLEDGSNVLAPLLMAEPSIGMPVRPRMRLSRITDEHLRVYDIAYEEAVSVAVTPKEKFPGYILALTGPSGVGKSTVRRTLVHMFSDYVAQVPILTTRKPKKSDDGEYVYIPAAMFNTLKQKGGFVASVTLPSTGEERSYGYRASDIEAIWKSGKIPVVITEMHLLQDLADRYGRRSILSCGLLPPGKSKRAMLSALLHRLRTRGRETEASIAVRLKNAEKDLQFFKDRSDLFDHIMVNDDLDKVIEHFKQKVPELALS